MSAATLISVRLSLTRKEQLPHSQPAKGNEPQMRIGEAENSTEKRELQ